MMCSLLQSKVQPNHMNETLMFLSTSAVTQCVCLPGLQRSAQNLKNKTHSRSHCHVMVHEVMRQRHDVVALLGEKPILDILH